MKMKTKMKYAIPAFAAAAALVLTGCTNNEAAEAEGSAGDSDTARTWAEIEESGVLNIGTIVDYPPNEFKTESGEPTGWAVDMVSEIANELGLEVEWEILEFDGILPRIEAGSIDMGVGSFTDTVERQQVVDFVNYYEAGTLWAAQAGSTINPEDACGLRVAVMAGGTQHHDELPTRSEACEADGKEPIEIMPFTGQPEVTNAIVTGQADAFSADSPITIDAVTALDGEIEVVGDMVDSAPYGFPVPRGSELGPKMQEALQKLMDDGRYLEILEAGNSEQGALSEATINAGTK